MEETMLLAGAERAAKRILAEDGFEVKDASMREPEMGPSFLVALKDDEPAIRLVALVVPKRGETTDVEALRPEAERAMLEWLAASPGLDDQRIVFDLVEARAADPSVPVARVRYTHDALGARGGA